MNECELIRLSKIYKIKVTKKIILTSHSFMLDTVKRRCDYIIFLHFFSYIEKFLIWLNHSLAFSLFSI